MKGGLVAAAAITCCSSAAAAASSLTPTTRSGGMPAAAAGTALPTLGFVRAAGAPSVSSSSWVRRAQQLHERKIIIGGSPSRAGVASPPAAGGGCRRRTAMAMLVDTKVEAPSRSSSSSGSSGAEDAPPALPPVPMDSFRHKSLDAEPTDYGPYLNVGSYKINAFGAYFMVCALFWAFWWAIVLAFQTAFIKSLDKVDPMRRSVDFASATWGWLSCASTGLLPEITGVENIPDGPAVFVANHASWMDVPYSAQLPVHCKYLAKSDLKKVPVLGDAMALAQHVLLDRDDKRSQMEALRSALDILKKGTPVFVFPEGTRGPGGRMQAFKMGAFKVATKAGVPIVPVSIAGTHLVMPKEVIMPQRSGGVTALHVHPPIPTQGRTDKELADLAFDIINDALPDVQKSLTPADKDSAASPM